MAEYARPDALVSTAWVAERLNDPSIRIVESDEDVLLYEVGHIPGAIKMDWHTDMQNPTVRDFVNKEEFEALCSRCGISNDTTVVFYGDRSNWFAIYGLWLFRMYGHQHLKVMNGGRAKWVEENRPLTTEASSYPAASYTAQPADPTIRAFKDDVLEHIKKAGVALIDVRSPGEFSGEMLHMPNYPQEGAMRAGHIPTAVSIPWATAANEDGTFKSADELEKIYGTKGVTKDKDIIAYCRIGERSSHTWFVLQYLLGYPNVRNYDGSWTEWGSSVRVPIEKSA